LLALVIKTKIYVV